LDSAIITPPFTIKHLFKQLLLTLLVFANTNYFTEKHAETCTLTHPLLKDDSPMPNNDDPQLNTAGIRRRDFIVTSGAAVATAAIGALGFPTRLPAQAAKTQKAQITFASARFFATDTMQQVIDSYNKSQNAVQVSYVELPPPSSSTEVHQQLVQQLARKNGTPDVFTQDIIWIAEFAEAGWALPLDSYFGA
jgi:hypothetical protein